MRARVVDLDAVRASRARLDALAREHPELCSPDARERAAAWLANEPDDDTVEDENEDNA